MVKMGMLVNIQYTIHDMHRGLSGTLDQIMLTSFICMYLKAEIIKSSLFVTNII